MLPVNGVGCSPGKGGVGATLVIEVYPGADAATSLTYSAPGVQLSPFVFERAAGALDEDVVEEPALAVHGDPHAGLPQGVGPGPGG